MCILPENNKWSVYQSLNNSNNYKHYSFNAFNEIDDTTFGGAVKKHRIEKHLTIKQVAYVVGISVDTLMRIEKNKYDLHNADKLKKLCEVLDLDKN